MNHAMIAADERERIDPVLERVLTELLEQRVTNPLPGFGGRVHLEGRRHLGVHFGSRVQDGTEGFAGLSVGSGEGSERASRPRAASPGHGIEFRQ